MKGSYADRCRKRVWFPYLAFKLLNDDGADSRGQRAQSVERTVHILSVSDMVRFRCFFPRYLKSHTADVAFSHVQAARSKRGVEIKGTRNRGGVAPPHAAS